jgi:hypothetical protein
MMLAMPDEPATPPPDVLGYHTPVPQVPAPDPLTAVLLSLPGLTCWVMFGMIIVAIVTRSSRIARALRIIPPQLMIVLWAVAVVTALFAVYRYRSAGKPWYVGFCLLVNASGLCFTALVLVASALLYAGAGGC